LPLKLATEAPINGGPNYEGLRLPPKTRHELRGDAEVKGQPAIGSAGPSL
jgi:hypothetical protein